MCSDTPTETTQDPVEGTPELPKTIAFEHGFFTAIEDSYFRTLEDNGEPVLIMTMENQGEVSLKLSGVQKELQLKDDEPDTKMLHVVAESLKYVREIKIGDPVPSEISSGRASWEITDDHRSIAHNRITMQLVSWMSGDEIIIADPNELAQLVDDPATKKKISDAFNEAAKALGISEDRREDVISLIANLANELAYIEALRTKYIDIQMIYKKILDLEKLYKSEQGIREDIMAIRRLFKIALTGFKDSFLELDAQTGEILSALNNIAPVTKFIRNYRDELRRRLWAWDGIINTWRDLPARRSNDIEKRLNNLYHFLAQRFLPRNEWELYSDALKKTKKRATEVIW